MKRLLVLPLLLTLFSCNESSDTENKTYLSCEIYSSHATQVTDRETDLSQCWDAEASYESQVYAIEWCASEVSDYMASQYDEAHTVTYKVQKTACSDVTE